MLRQSTSPRPILRRPGRSRPAPGRFIYETNYLVDIAHAVILDVEAAPARLSQEIVAAKRMLERTG
jgi:hypothetical protein